MLLLGRFSRVRLCVTHRLQPTRLLHPWDSPGKNTGVGCHFLLQGMKVKSESEVAQSCPTHRDPTDCSPPGSSVRGIFQARALEWGAIAFSDGFCAKDPLSLVAHLPSWFSLSSPLLYQTHSALYICAGAVLKAVCLMNKENGTDVIRKWIHGLSLENNQINNPIKLFPNQYFKIRLTSLLVECIYLLVWSWWS